jgi:L-ascorbate metabolism protein UlaG (beta-lactamase superfamily)
MKRSSSMLLAAIVVFASLFLFATAYAGEHDVTITFWGQSAFKLEGGGKIVLIDPWLAPGNPVSPVTADDIPTADLILVTHDHFDHVGDTIAIAKKTGATVVAVYETALRLISDGLPPANVLYGGFGRDIGGAIDINGISIVMTPAVHSSNSGAPTGYIIKFPNGPTVYHAGDTALFGDMLLYGTLYPIDMALLPIGGGFTMDALQAAQSLKLLRPGKTIPMHYGTFPMLAPNPDQFVSLAGKLAPAVDVIVLKPGSQYVLHQ